MISMPEESSAGSSTKSSQDSNMISSSSSKEILSKKPSMMSKLFGRGRQRSKQQAPEPTPPSSRGSDSISRHFDVNFKENPCVRPLHPNKATPYVRVERYHEEYTEIPALKARENESDFYKRLREILNHACPGVLQDYNQWLRYMQDYAEGKYSTSNPPTPPRCGDDFTYLQAPFSPSEVERNTAIAALGPEIFTEEQQEQLLTIAQTVQVAFGVSGVIISIIDHEIEHVKLSSISPFNQIPRVNSIAAHALLGTEIMVVHDTKNDWRFANSPVVVGGPLMNFFAGVPLIAPTGEAIGVFYIFDTNPRETFTEEERQQLLQFNDEVSGFFSLRKNIEHTPPVTPTSSRPFSTSDLTSVDDNARHCTPEPGMSTGAWKLSPGNLERRLYDNIPDSPTLGSLSPLTVGDNPINPENKQVSSAISCEGAAGQNFYDRGISTINNPLLEANPRGPEMDAPELRDAMAMLARSATVDLMFVIRVTPREAGLSNEELLAPGGLEMQVVSTGPGALDGLTNIGTECLGALGIKGLVQVSPLNACTGIGVLMPICVDEMGPAEKPTSGLVLGAFYFNAPNVTYKMCEDVLRVGSFLKSILSGTFFPPSMTGNKPIAESGRPLP